MRGVVLRIERQAMCGEMSSGCHLHRQPQMLTRQRSGVEDVVAELIECRDLAGPHEGQADVGEGHPACGIVFVVEAGRPIGATSIAKRADKRMASRLAR